MVGLITIVLILEVSGFSVAVFLLEGIDVTLEPLFGFTGAREDEGRRTDGFLGGVTGAFSLVLDDEAWVGRIIRARKSWSTWLSLADFECSSSFLGGGPTLGLG